VRIAPDGADALPAEGESRITSVVKRVLGLGSDAKLKVRGFDDLLVYRAKCCNPIRGEEIIGYITRGKGVAVHSKNCPNVQNLLYDAARKIEVEWAGVAPQAEAYAVPLTIVSENRAGILAQIAAVVAEVGSNIVHVEAKTADERGTIDLVVEIPDMKHLERVLSSIRRIDGVYEVIRTTRIVNQAK
jgi:GTP pyrophosphokinase